MKVQQVIDKPLGVGPLDEEPGRTRTLDGVRGLAHAEGVPQLERAHLVREAPPHGAVYADEVVGEAANGFEAIAHAYALRPDVILMDVAMPHMDGVEATTRIRAELPDIRILGLSTLARTEAADAIEQAGAAGFFVKGTDTRRLIEQLLAYHAELSAGDHAGS